MLAQISNQADVLVEKADEKSGVTVNAESENSFVNIAGAVSINEIGNRTAAYVSNSKVNGGKFVSADNVEIKAESGADIFALAGNISAAGTGGVGASVAVNEIDNTTESYAKTPILKPKRAIFRSRRKILRKSKLLRPASVTAARLPFPVRFPSTTSITALTAMPTIPV